MADQSSSRRPPQPETPVKLDDAPGLPARRLAAAVIDEVLRARVAARVNDASDADVAVLETQLTRDAGAIAWRKVDTVNAFEDEARALAETMG